MKRLALKLAGLVLFPIYWIMAYAVRTPGLAFRMLCALKGMRLLLRERDFARAYGLLVAPLDSVRYFEFDFMWNAVKGIRMQSYLDVSSPRILPLMITDREKNLVADLINPDKKDLPATISLAKSFGGPVSLPPEVTRLLLGVDGSWLDAAFDQIRLDHGSVEGYLRDELGVGPRELARLRKHMLGKRTLR